MRLRSSARSERLGDVVVGARLEALDGVGLAVERGEHDDRDDVAPGAQRAGDVVAGRPGPSATSSSTTSNRAAVAASIAASPLPTAVTA